jgi:hypothetical protein
MMERVTTDLLHPQRDRVYELVRRRADQAVAVQRAIDKRTAATVQRMQAFVDCEDALEIEAHRRNDLFDAVHGRVR